MKREHAAGILNVKASALHAHPKVVKPECLGKTLCKWPILHVSARCNETCNALMSIEHPGVIALYMYTIHIFRNAKLTEGLLDRGSKQHPQPSTSYL